MWSILKKIEIRYLFLFIIVAILSFCYSCFFTWFCGDEIWNYGFSYNIFKGMIIYRDFNCMQTPLFFILGSVFIKIFGNYLYSLYIFIAILTAMIMCILYKIMNRQSFIILPFLFLVSVPSYNFLCLFFLFLILYFINKNRDNDIIMSIIIGLLCLTKQSIGILLFIPFLLFAKNKLKSFFVFFIPISICLLYLILNNALFEFIDYCFLGLLDFGEKNGDSSIFTVLEMFILIYLILQIFKTKFKDKELFYILMFQIMVYPIFDIYHFLVSFIPVLYFFLKKEKSLYFISIIFFTIYLLFVVFLSTYSININKEDNFLYLLNDSRDILKIVESESKIISLYYEDYDYVFYIMTNAYIRKLYMDFPINKYDFMLNGNMGYNGGERYVNEIDDICDVNTCVFFVDEHIFDSGYTQFSKEIYDYVVNNYKMIEEYSYFSVYTNK